MSSCERVYPISSIILGRLVYGLCGYPIIPWTSGNFTFLSWAWPVYCAWLSLSTERFAATTRGECALKHVTTMDNGLHGWIAVDCNNGHDRLQLACYLTWSWCGMVQIQVPEWDGAGFTLVQSQMRRMGRCYQTQFISVIYSHGSKPMKYYLILDGICTSVNINQLFFAAPSWYQGPLTHSHIRAFTLLQAGNPRQWFFLRGTP